MWLAELRRALFIRGEVGLKWRHRELQISESRIHETQKTLHGLAATMQLPKRLVAPRR